MMSPGPDLKVSVQCSIINDVTTIQSTKVFNVSIIDRNDNVIRVQDKVTNLTLNSPYFVKVGGTFLLIVRLLISLYAQINVLSFAFPCKKCELMINVISLWETNVRMY